MLPQPEELDDLIHSVIEASIYSFKRIHVEDMVAFAVNGDPRGFYAFNHSHWKLAKTVAEQSKHSDHQ